jgi:hypothetical protein
LSGLLVEDHLHQALIFAERERRLKCDYPFAPPPSIS